jgi:hypothetical protein
MMRMSKKEAAYRASLRRQPSSLPSYAVNSSGNAIVLPQPAK